MVKSGPTPATLGARAAKADDDARAPAAKWAGGAAGGQDARDYQAQSMRDQRRQRDRARAAGYSQADENDTRAMLAREMAKNHKASADRFAHKPVFTADELEAAKRAGDAAADDERRRRRDAGTL